MTLDHTLARELLAFYQEAGVDAVLGETPVDRFADPAPVSVTPPPAEPAAPAPVASQGRAPQGFGSTVQARTGETRTIEARELDTFSRGATAAPPVPDEAIMAAREVAKSAASLEELRTILDRFDGCALKATATQLVFADGNPASRLMLVG